MRRSVAEMIVRDPEKYAHHDRVFLNNPVVMQGMGLAPLVVLATTGKNALMLAVSVALLLTPSRMLACLLSRAFPLRDEQPAKEELEKKLLPRGLIYSGSAAVVYLAVYPILNALFGVDLLALGIYLPMLVVEPLLTYRFGRVQESPRKALSKGVRITVGYSLLLLLLGCVREWLSAGTVFGHLLSRPILRIVFGRIDDDVMSFSQTYFLISAISYPFIGFYNAGAALFRAQGNSRISMLASLVMNVINIAGNALLIYGFGMGVIGAALATLIGRVFAAVFILWQNQDLHNPLRVQCFADLRPRRRPIMQILSIGIPSGLETVSYTHLTLPTIA